MTQTKAVLIFGACVMAAAIGLIVMMGGGEEATTATPTKPTEPTGRITGSAATPPPLAETRKGEKPTVTASDTPRQPAAAEGTKEYELDGRKVRDHRSGDRAPIDVPPAVHPAEGPRIPSKLTSAIGQKVRAKVEECGKQIPAAARGEKPRVEGLVVIAIKNKVVTVTSATMQLRNVEGAAVDTAKACIEAGALTITESSTEPDLASYDINISFGL
ncbi:MAG: hypothetical protein SFX73_37020 [Kofleriaceae bacterium]|nr:hypothetical protein [Kofleriaceae bacterium]